MKNLICYILLLSSLNTWAQTTNQTDTNELKQGMWEKTSPEGKPIYKGEFKDGKPVGKWKRYHTNGMLRAQLNYGENSDSCAVILFDNQGKKIAEGTYVDELREGKWLFFRSMLKISEENYLKGKKDGVTATFYDTGELMSECNFTNGTANGAYRAYHKTGTVYFECMMRDGMRDGYCQSFFNSGAKESTGYYEKSIREGNWEYFHEDGSKAYTLIYKGGLVTNTAVSDSINNLRLINMEKNAKQIVDPEKFIDNPNGYMQNMRNQQR
ncbi:MAG: toxin-antitoxin system YwqK family antitoxin [Mangrovibacterium sp.]